MREDMKEGCSVRQCMKTMRDRKGVAAVEFALILPLLVVLLFGIIEFGLLLYNKQVITNASREGARAGIVQAPRLTVPQIRAVVNNYAKAYLITFAASDPGPQTLVPSGACTTFGQDLIASVTYQYQFLIFSSVIKLLPGVFSSSITLTAQTDMKCE